MKYDNEWISFGTALNMLHLDELGAREKGDQCNKATLLNHLMLLGPIADILVCSLLAWSGRWGSKLHPSHYRANMCVGGGAEFIFKNRHVLYIANYDL